MTKAPALEPCPNRLCGKPFAVMRRSPASSMFYGRCDICMCEGPHRDTEAEAIAAWNARLDGDEAWVTENDDGSISLDPYAGWPRQQLKAHCRKLSSALSDWQFAAWSAATCKGNLLANVPEPYRAKIESLIDAYSDSGEEAERYKQGELSDGASHE